MTSAAHDLSTHYVYELWCAEAPMYVGVTGNLRRRLREHAKQQPWWPDVTHLRVTAYPTRISGWEAEAHRIVELKPAHNRNGLGLDGPLVFGPPTARERKAMSLTALRASKAEASAA